MQKSAPWIEKWRRMKSTHTSALLVLDLLAVDQVDGVVAGTHDALRRGVLVLLVVAEAVEVAFLAPEVVAFKALVCAL